MRIVSNSVEETQKLGRDLAALLREGDFVALFGELGSGKTTLAQSIMKALGVKEHYLISPTFVLVREYEGKFKIFHFDLYRLNYLEELLDLGYEDYFYSPKGVTLVEWAQKVEEFLPTDYFKIELAGKTENSRVIKISAVGGSFKKRLLAWERKFKK